MLFGDWEHFLAGLIKTMSTSSVVEINVADLVYYHPQTHVADLVYYHPQTLD